MGKKFEMDSNLNKAQVSFSLEKVAEDSNKTNKVDYRYAVKNIDSKEIILEFSSGMKYDFYITDENGNVVYRDSNHKVYIQVIQEIKLSPGEEEMFPVTLPKLDEGNYTLTIILAEKRYKDQEVSVDFSVDI